MRRYVFKREQGLLQERKAKKFENTMWVKGQDADRAPHVEWFMIGCLLT